MDRYLQEDSKGLNQVLNFLGTDLKDVGVKKKIK
jgi:hypothetical protein